MTRSVARVGQRPQHGSRGTLKRANSGEKQRLATCEKGEFVAEWAMSSEAKKYWQYSAECGRQAVRADTPELRDQLLDLARVWAAAAIREEMESKRLREEAA